MGCKRRAISSSDDWIHIMCKYYARRIRKCCCWCWWWCWWWYNCRNRWRYAAFNIYTGQLKHNQKYAKCTGAPPHSFDRSSVTVTIAYLQKKIDNHNADWMRAALTSSIQMPLTLYDFFLLLLAIKMNSVDLSLTQWTHSPSPHHNAQFRNGCIVRGSSKIQRKYFGLRNIWIMTQ